MSRFGYSVKIFFVVLLFLIPSVEGQNPEYGEDSTSLGQVVDEYTDLDNVSVRVLIERNATLNAMELNFSGSGTPLYENYSLYTEVDPNNRFAITDSAIVVSSLSNHDDHHYVTFDYGAGFFTDFTHDLEARGRDDSGSAGNDRMWIWLLANVTDEPIQMIVNNEEIVGIYFSEFDVSDPNSPEITLREYENAVLFLDRFEPAVRDVWYYFRIIKLGTSIKVGIYSTGALRDSGDATDGDLDNLALTLQEDFNYGIIYAVAGLNTGTPTVRLHSGDIQNLTIGRVSGGYASSGYFTTVDYLSKVNGSSLVLLVNTTIPSGAVITVEFSDDNSTWVNSTILTEGFQSIDLRALNFSSQYYLRYNFTGPGTDTPRLYQSRLITTVGAISVEGGGESFIVVGLMIGLLLGAGILLSGLKK